MAGGRGLRGTAIRLSRNGWWERRTPVRQGLGATRTGGVFCEIAPHWGAALPGRARAAIGRGADSGRV